VPRYHPLSSMINYRPRVKEKNGKEGREDVLDLSTSSSHRNIEPLLPTSPFLASVGFFFFFLAFHTASESLVMSRDLKVFGMASSFQQLSPPRCWLWGRVGSAGVVQPLDLSTEMWMSALLFPAQYMHSPHTNC
jgi:hypothetical protein